MQKINGIIMNSAITRGQGNARKFEWNIIDSKIHIESESKIEHEYSFSEISAALMWLVCKFGEDQFPLANNVAKIPKGEEKDGLGMALYSIRKNLHFAQGSSYLGVVLEKLGIFEYVDSNVISWRIPKSYVGFGSLIDKLR
jgi:hypothetical protein